MTRTQKATGLIVAALFLALPALHYSADDAGYVLGVHRSLLELLVTLAVFVALIVALLMEPTRRTPVIEPMLDEHLDICSACDGQIVRASGPGGETLRIDADPGVEKGNLALHTSGGKLFAAPLSRGQAEGMRSAGRVVYVDHALTCTKADTWHKAGTHGKATRRYATVSRGRRR